MERISKNNVNDIRFALFQLVQENFYIFFILWYAETSGVIKYLQD